MIKDIFRVLVSNFGVTIIGICNSFFLPKVLTIDQYAIYQTFVLYMTYTAALHLGFPSGMFIKYAGKSYSEINKGEYKTELSIIEILLLFFSVIAVIVSGIMNSKVFLLVSMTIFPYCLVGSFKSLYQAFGEFGKYSVVNFAIPFATLIMNILFWMIYKSLTWTFCVFSFVISYLVVTIYILFTNTLQYKNIKINKILDKKNAAILSTGFLLMIGNYINTLFLSADKQFIKIFYDDYSFAYYSFAMSMQAIMVVFITSISQPLFPKMAKKGFNKDECKSIEEMLIIFGSLSGSAYFFCDIIINMFIPKYINSLNVLKIYFAVFPFLAVINCLIINLYKSEGKIRKYILSLVLALICAVALDMIVVLLKIDYIYIAGATLLAYIIWMHIGIKDFAFLKLNLRDIVFLCIFLMIYYVTTSMITNSFIGLFAYFIVDSLAVIMLYFRKIKMFIYMLKEN